MINDLINFDQRLFLYLNGMHHPFFDFLMPIITHRLTWVPFYILIIYFILKKYTQKEAFYYILLLCLTVGATDLISSGILKPQIARLRPCHLPTLWQKVHLIVGCGGQYGFVSSHAANSFALFVGVRFVFQRSIKWTTFMLLWAILVSYSRIYVGVHYPLDVMGGAFLGTLISLLFFKFIPEKINKKI